MATVHPTLTNGKPEHIDWLTGEAVYPDEPPVPDVFAADFDGYPDELPAAISDCCPGDIVIHAPRWQGTLDTPAAIPFEPSDADWDDMARWCEWVDRNDEIRRDADVDAAQAEARARYGL